jgi:Uma2 family endonuclease
MSHPAEGPRLLTVEEYRALELTSDVRHEYVNGIVRAMSGESRVHNRIVGNVYRRLVEAAGGGPCRVYVNAIRVRLRRNVFYYPDVVVACGEPGDSHEEDAPCLVVEVLSPTTRETDLREKALNYRRKRSIQAYLVVHQYEARVERHYRDAGAAWRYDDVAGAGDVPVPCPETALTLDEIYDGVVREAGGYWPRPRRVRERDPMFHR